MATKPLLLSSVKAAPSHLVSDSFQNISACVALISLTLGKSTGGTQAPVGSSNIQDGLFYGLLHTKASSDSSYFIPTDAKFFLKTFDWSGSTAGAFPSLLGV